MVKDEQMRLQVFLAHSGVASRRKCEEYIQDGLVKVNGQLVTEPGFKVTPQDAVVFRRRRVYMVRNLVYIALNKPSRYLSTTKDPEGRPLALDLLKPALDMRLYPVGRLDFLSSGLLLFTNDGEFSQAVSHPGSCVEKEYLVDTKKEIPEEFLKEYQKGLMVEGVRYRLKSYKLLRGARSAVLVLEEGKNREIRKVFASRGLYPRKIHRIRIGHISVRGLDSGKFRRLTRREVETFMKKRKAHGSGD
ncbi:MAG: rRNA pseudouridine synthase [Spirochaetales bacterium]|jgi:23S rRNA pseudouridine2605 synthase|nr:rRNA pseudouridine synthase [Spirochaetales bacterium]